MEKGANFLKPAFANILGAIICYAIVLILLLFRLGDIWPFFPIILVLTFLFLSIAFDNIQNRTFTTTSAVYAGRADGNDVAVHDAAHLAFI